jgi:outer membrane protein TolC
VFSLLVTATAAHAAPQPRIAVITDGPSDLFDQVTGLLSTEVDTLLGEETCPFAPTARGEHTRASADRILREALADRRVDWIVGIGPLIGQAVGRQKSLSKPVFLPFAAPGPMGLPRRGVASGMKNLVYLSGLLDLDIELRRLSQVVRTEEAIMLVDSSLAAMIRDYRGDKPVEGSGIKPRIIPAAGGAAQILAAIPEDAAGVYLSILPRLPFAEIDALIDGLNARKLPTYAQQGRAWVERGAYLTLVPADDQLRRMRQLALYMSDAQRGEPLEAMSTVFEPRAELVINTATARKIGIYPTFELLTEAETVGEEERARRGRPLALADAANEAVAANLALRAERYERDIAEAQLADAWGSVLPVVDVRGDYDWLDPDVAITSAERTASWGVSGQQVLFSAAAIQGIAAQKHLNKSAGHGVRTVELDIVRDAATAFINVLRARTGERISRENLRRTRRNLALAEVRGEVGVAGPAEIYRWQAEIADDRASLIEASARRNQAEIALNQLLNRPLEEPFAPVEPSDSPEVLVLDPRTAAHVDDPWRFKVFRAFMVEEAMRNAPELERLDELIDAQERIDSALTQQLFLPDLFAAAGFTNTLDRAGAGSKPAPGVPAIQDDFTWQVGVGLRLNLFDWGHYAALDEVEAKTAQLRTNRDLAAQRIEQRVRSALHQAGFSRAAVALREDAATAARKNLELVTDAYRQGAVDIITLVDAQNQTFLAEQAAATAVYDFIADYIAVERAVGSFAFRISKAERDAVFERLLVFERELSSNGATP